VSKETRYNLIFIVILLVLMVPGGVMLFRKKLEPTERPMYLPDPVRQTVAYMSPEETPPGMSRVAPQHTTNWVAGMKADIAGLATARPRDELGMPLMSQSKSFEVVTYAGDDHEGFRVLVLFWRPPPEAQAWSIGGQGGRVEFSREFALPNRVREELGAHGVLVPPKRVTFQSIHFAEPPSGEWALTLSDDQRTSDSAKIVQSFTSHAATRN